MDTLHRLITTDFMPHGYCFLWLPEILWLHVFSDGLIALSYFMIPTALALFVLKRQELPFPWMFLMFASFITACGLTHVMGIWTVWNPDYGVEGLVKLGTGVVSIATAATLIPLMPRALALRSPGELEMLNRALESEIAQHRRTEAALQRVRAELEDRVAARTAELTRSNERLRQEVEERNRAQQQQRLLLQELNHRVKNTLAIVQSLVTQTLGSSASPEEFAEAFKGRLASLAQAHTLLTRTSWQGTMLADLVQGELEPYRRPAADNVVVEGEPLVLTPAATLSLTLILHELVTNAAKHGALSTDGGKVSVSWSVMRDGPDGALEIRWLESGGPPVAPPAGRGFGSKLIERGVVYDLGGSSELEFHEQGVRCTLRIPDANLAEVATFRHGPASIARSGAGATLQGRRVLVVEDQFLVALELEAALRDLGCEPVGPASNLEQAMTMVDGAAFDGAILDVNLGGERVYPLADELRRRGVPIIFATGYDAEVVMPERFRNTLVLRKPINHADMGRALRNALPPPRAGDPAEPAEQALG